MGAFPVHFIVLGIHGVIHLHHVEGHSLADAFDGFAHSPVEYLFLEQNRLGLGKGVEQGVPLLEVLPGVLTDTLAPGDRAQAAAGWGNDHYRLFTRGDDTTLVWSYLAETVEDAEDLTNGLIAHARGAMGAGESEESGGGLLFSGSPTVVIDRVDDAIWFIASTDPGAVAEARSQLGL